MRNKFFVGGDLGDKKVTWVKWNVCLASKALGGLVIEDDMSESINDGDLINNFASKNDRRIALSKSPPYSHGTGPPKSTRRTWLGIGSRYALNMSLLFKWIWRFQCNPNDLWAKVIRSIHGQDGGIGGGRILASNLSPWKVIVNSVFQLQSKGVNLLAACKRSLGDGMNISFWDESWCGNSLLKVSFPHVYALEGDKKSKVAQRINNLDWNTVLRRAPRGGVDPNGFSVASARKFIDEHILPCGLSCTRWNKGVPIKVNVFMWRLNLDKLPSMVNMERKGIDIDSLLCPVYGDHVENVDHLFFSCGMARELWRLLARWCDLDIPSVASIAE
ncbi:RNA-directed DNA polymerase, eukaryota, reverse transcriptase zinc-binding domain protein [Tanacetum coccineum]